jgi:hypothetical protein
MNGGIGAILERLLLGRTSQEMTMRLSDEFLHE